MEDAHLAYTRAVQNHADPETILRLTAEYNRACIAYPGNPEALPYEVTRSYETQKPRSKSRTPAPATPAEDAPATAKRRSSRQSRHVTRRRRHTQPPAPHIDGLLPLF